MMTEDQVRTALAQAQADRATYVSYGQVEETHYVDGKIVAYEAVLNGK